MTPNMETLLWAMDPGWELCRSESGMWYVTVRQTDGGFHMFSGVTPRGAIERALKAKANNRIRKAHHD